MSQTTVTDFGDPQLMADVEALCAGTYRAGPRLFLDLAIWISAVWATLRLDHPLATLTAVFFIGAVPLHDLLILGHEGTHDLISRRPWLNEALTGLCFGTVGLSRAAHRALHHEHHRVPHQPGDPELRVFQRVNLMVPGWAYLLIPFVATAGVNLYPFRKGGPTSVRVQVAIDLGLAAVLHAALLFGVGPKLYLLFVVGPMVTGLYLATIARSIGEHHGLPEGEARSIESSALVGILWSNVNFHFEHHLFPGVPYHRLPALRQRLGTLPAGRGYLPTTIALLRERAHFNRS